MVSRTEPPSVQTSCGVLVSNGRQLLLGHATRSPRWDIPKGVAEAGEAFIDAAIRELSEETGLSVDGASLVDFGVHRYLPRKQLALFAWRRDPLPDPAGLACASMATIGGVAAPEFDRFGIFAWDEALQLVGKNLRRVLEEARGRLGAPR